MNQVAVILIAVVAVVIGASLAFSYLPSTQQVETESSSAGAVVGTNIGNVAPDFSLQDADKRENVYP